jgi:uncharacterized membrane protein SpoIIM required for sporulation
MTPAQFIAQHGAQWDAFEQRLAVKAGTADATSFPAEYRRICRHLALARERRYPQDTIDRLNALAMAGQLMLYAPRRRLGADIAAFLAAGFPQAVRRHGCLLALALAVFYLPLLASLFATWAKPTLIYSLMPVENVAQYEAMYDAGRKVIGPARDDADNLAMFGFYISNNVGIGFQTFAAGLLAGVGSLFLLVYNGLAIGMVAGYLTARGHGEMFWQFVCGHGAFELNAIALCGLTGLMLGRALVAPGRQLRHDALVAAAREAVPMLYGAALMLFIAAVIEAFWSSRMAIAADTKFAMAAFWWLLVIAYFTLAGRTPAAATVPTRAP